MLKEPPVLKMVFVLRGMIPRGTTFKFKFLSEFEIEIKNIFRHESGAHMGLIHEKNQRPKISCYCTFKSEPSLASLFSAWALHFCFIFGLIPFLCLHINLSPILRLFLVWALFCVSVYLDTYNPLPTTVVFAVLYVYDPKTSSQDLIAC